MSLQGNETPLPNGKAIMCAYKLCKVEFRYWGMQTKIEKFIHETGELIFVYLYAYMVFICPNSFTRNGLEISMHEFILFKCLLVYTLFYVYAHYFLNIYYSYYYYIFIHLYATNIVFTVINLKRCYQTTDCGGLSITLFKKYFVFTVCNSSYAGTVQYTVRHQFYSITSNTCGDVINK